MIQVYTGNGKGKTTAALGLALRAAGAGLSVYIGQFAKGRQCSELAALKKFKNITLKQFGSGCFIIKRITLKDKLLAEAGIKELKKALASKKYQVIILDEVNVAVDLGLVTAAQVISLVRKCPRDTELILTGRNALAEMTAIADLVTEMKEIKHYFNKGVPARKGIEY